MRKPKRKFDVVVNEGDWYAIPLRQGGYGLGLVARKARGGILFGYFFGPRYEQVPTLADTLGRRGDQALFCKRFADLGIQDKEWPFVGRLETWKRGEWPVPDFGRIEDETRGRAWIVHYEEEDINCVAWETQCSPEEARRHPSNGFSGSGAIEIVLSAILAGEPVAWWPKPRHGNSTIH